MLTHSLIVHVYKSLLYLTLGFPKHTQNILIFNDRKRGRVLCVSFPSLIRKKGINMLGRLKWKILVSWRKKRKLCFLNVENIVSDKQREHAKLWRNEDCVCQVTDRRLMVSSHPGVKVSVRIMLQNCKPIIKYSVYLLPLVHGLGLVMQLFW